MAAVRKSAVSVTGSRFWRDSTPSSRKRRSARLGRAVQSPTTLTAQTSSLPTNKLSQSDNQQVSNLKVKSSAAQKSPRTGSVGVPAMPSSGAIPVWLLRLSKSHGYSSVVAFLLVAATLAVYGWTVYSRELWSQNLRRLDSLRLRERQLTTTNATLTNKMAEEAQQPTTGLVSPTPARTIFLRLPSGTTNLAPPSTTPNPQTQQPTSSPQGY